MQQILSYRAPEPPTISSHRLDLIGGLLLARPKV